MSAPSAKLWRLSAITLALFLAAASAQAGSPQQLTDGQLDRVTAGSFVVFSSADEQATGLITMGSSSANSVVGSIPTVVAGFDTQGGIASGEATSFGTNGAGTGLPPATSSTSVTTGGTPDGNYNIVITTNRTSSAGGLTIQGGFTSVYSAIIPGL
ncbi:MAG TPA: hypothetical protein VLX09_04255 [Stellaceae bacterium]|nr:hypothetical protein [Stellaceae bacterium]